MEPLFFKAENLRQRCTRLPVHSALQWSRFFSKRKIILGKIVDRVASGASMEPLFFKAENSHVIGTVWAATLASMEPLFFKAENRLPPGAPGRHQALQWSRFFSKRKIRTALSG